MAIERPDFENWSDEDFETRSDEVCAYVHTLELSDADWMSGAEYRLWRVVRNRSAAEALMLDAIPEARDDGVSIDRIAEIVGVSADAAGNLCGEAVDRRRSRESKPTSRSLGS